MPELINVVRLLLEEDTEASSQRYYDHALQAASRYGRSEVVNLPLEAQAEVDSKDRWYGQKLFSLAAERGHLEVVKRLC